MQTRSNLSSPQPPNQIRLLQEFVISAKDPDFAGQLKKDLAERVKQRLFDLQDDSLP